MAGIEKTFSRYPQLYSRVGFAHHYRPLTGEELTFVLSRHWHRLGVQLTVTTSPTPKPSLPSPAAPAAPSGSCNGYSLESSAS